jgi:hypothetical protein
MPQPPFGTSLKFAHGAQSFGLTLLVAAWLLCLGVAIMQIRSPGRKDSLVWASVSPNRTKGGGYYAISDNGALRLGFETWQLTGGASIYYCATFARPPGVSFVSNSHPYWAVNDGFWAIEYMDAQPAAYIYHEHLVRIPWWAISVVLWSISGPVTYLYFRRRRDARLRERKGLCPRCGYDLRATPHRCPECGAFPQRDVPIVRTD